MSGKPTQICNLQEGKFVGGQRGFCATYNWLASCAENAKGGKGVAIKNVDAGLPEIEAMIEPGEGIDVQCTGPGQPYTISLLEPTGGGGGNFDLSVIGTDGTVAEPLSGYVQLSALPGCNLSAACAGNTISLGVYWL